MKAALVRGRDPRGRSGFHRDNELDGRASQRRNYVDPSPREELVIFGIFFANFQDFFFSRATLSGSDGGFGE
jgi:hypothetical protein